MTLTDWLTLATLIATAATLIFVLMGEMRYRRQYRRVDFHIDHVGEGRDSNGAGFEVFDLTNCGTETATQISMTVVGGKPASTADLRPIRVLGPGETKRFLVVPIDDLKDCWVLFSFYAASERRYSYFMWEPLIEDGPLFDVQCADMNACTDTIRARIALRWRRMMGTVEVVGPHAAPDTRVRVHRGDRTATALTIAGQKRTEWFERWRQLKESVEPDRDSVPR